MPATAPCVRGKPTRVDVPENPTICIAQSIALLTCVQYKQAVTACQSLKPENFFKPAVDFFQPRNPPRPPWRKKTPGATKSAAHRRNPRGGWKPFAAPLVPPAGFGGISVSAGRANRRWPRWASLARATRSQGSPTAGIARGRTVQGVGPWGSEKKIASARGGQTKNEQMRTNRRDIEAFSGPSNARPRITQRHWLDSGAARRSAGSPAGRSGGRALNRPRG